MYNREKKNLKLFSICSIKTNIKICLNNFDFCILDLLDLAPAAVGVESGGDWVRPEEMTITWSPADLGTDTTHVNIVLVGYREFQDEKRIWQVAKILLAGCQVISGR